MAAKRMFLSLTSLVDPVRHEEYNAWHQLDHLPENLLLAGVVWGDRWVCTPDCTKLVTGELAAAGHQYAIAYWFRDPVEDSVARWTELNRNALWWGRRPEIGWTVRSPVGFFQPVKSYASPRVLVSPEAVLLRPHLGVHLTVSRVVLPGAPEAIDLMAAYDRHRIPTLLDVPGVAGVSTYTFHSPADGFGTASEQSTGALLVRLLHLDDDPVVTTERVLEADRNWVADTQFEEIVYAAPMRSIRPWEWSWFGESSGEPSE